MRPLPLMAAGLLAATLLTSPTAYAAAETCQGQPATIVGTFLQRDLTGTEGPDVVVTNGAIGVKTLGGDDLVCVTDEPGRLTGVTLDTGPGDDVVDGTWTLAEDRRGARAGSDTYSGSPGAGPGASPATRRSTTRRTRSGAGRAAAPPAAATRSSPDRAGCRTPTWWCSLASATRSSGRVRWPREGASTWGRTAGSCRTSARASVVIDAAAGTMTTDGVQTLAWTGPFTYFILSGLVAPALARAHRQRPRRVRLHPRSARATAGSASTSAAATTPCESPDGAGGVEELVRRRRGRGRRRPVGRRRASTSTSPPGSCGCARTGAA